MKINEFFDQGMLRLKLCIPYSQGNIVTRLHDEGQVEAVDYNDQGTVLEVILPALEAEKYMKYEIE